MFLQCLEPCNLAWDSEQASATWRLLHALLAGSSAPPPTSTASAGARKLWESNCSFSAAAYLGGELPGHVRQFWRNFLLLFCRQDAAKATYALIMIFTHMHWHQWANAIRHVSSWSTFPLFIAWESNQSFPSLTLYCCSYPRECCIFAIQLRAWYLISVSKWKMLSVTLKPSACLHCFLMKDILVWGLLFLFY